MKRVVAVSSLAWLLAAPGSSVAGGPAHRNLACAPATGPELTFDVPPKLGDLPKIDFDYPSKVTIFSFRDRNLLLIAIDASESGRVRVVISAQRDKATGNYDGQIVRDFGGNERQLENGPVRCKVSR